MDFNKPLSGLQTYLLNITFYLEHLFQKREELIFAPILKSNVAENSRGGARILREWAYGWQHVNTTICWPCKFLGKQTFYAYLICVSILLFQWVLSSASFLCLKIIVLLLLSSILVSSVHTLSYYFCFWCFVKCKV